MEFDVLRGFYETHYTSLLSFSTGQSRERCQLVQFSLSQQALYYFFSIELLLGLICCVRDRAGKKLPDAEPASTNDALGEDDFDADAPTEEEMAMLRGIIPFCNNASQRHAEPSNFQAVNKQCVLGIYH